MLVAGLATKLTVHIPYISSLFSAYICVYSEKYSIKLAVTDVFPR